MNEIVINQYRRSDIINGFIAGKNTFQPFCSCNLGNINFNEMVDNITSIIPGCTSTKNKQKFYEIVLNPDLPSVSSDTVAPSVPSDSSVPSNISFPSNISLPSNPSQQVQEVTQDLQNTLAYLNQGINDAKGLVNRVETGLNETKQALIKTVKDPVNNIFFLSQPKKAIVSTISKIKNLFRRRR